MRMLKPSWVHHEGNPVFSIDIHPDGSRFATGGQGGDSGKVVIWNMGPVRNEADEKDENVPKVLCEMNNHLACVNCVKWSVNGKYLASGGDDKLIMIWQFMGRYAGNSTVFNSNKVLNIEEWRCVHTLRSHTGDVLDLAWSPQDVWLASCSIDNTIVIWNACRFPEVLTVLKGHTGLVKGLTWDPIGKYLASQSDDKSLRVWRTRDWQQEAVVTKPFEECGGTTHVLRLAWSPDGHYIVSAHAMNNSGPTAQIIERDGWKANMDFVGHRKAITCAKFNPSIFSKCLKKTSTKPQQYCCCCIGSRDRSLSVWMTALKRPLMVMHDLFDNSVLDISWTQGKLELLACSWDGTVAYLDFTTEELGRPLTQEEMSTFHQKVYGKSVVSSQAAIIENPAMLKIQQQKQNSDQAGPGTPTPNGTLHNGSATPKKTAPPNPVIDTPGKPQDVKSKQIESRTSDGRKRITPVFIAPQVILGDIPGPFTIPSQTPFGSSSPQNASQKSEGKPNEDGGKPDQKGPESTQPTEITVTVQPIAALDSRFTEKSKATSSSATSKKKGERVAEVTPSSAKVTSLTAATKQKSSEKSKHKEDRGDGKKWKRKISEGGLKPHKRHKKDNKIAATQPSTPGGLEKEVHSSSKTVAAPPAFKLPVPEAKGSLSIQVHASSSVGGTVIELQNNHSVSGTVFHLIKCVKEGETSWETVLASKGLALDANKQIVVVCCEDRSLYAFSAGGRRLLPGVALSAPISQLKCNGYHVMAITSDGNINVWNMQTQRVLIKNESLCSVMVGKDISITESTLTEHGIPILSLSNGKSYTYNSSMSTWLVIHNKNDQLAQCSDHFSCLPSQDALHISGPLARLQGQGKRFSQQAVQLFHSQPSLQQVSTVSHLENQMAAALAVKSSKEYKFWLQAYTRYLAQEGLEGRLHEICDELLGPVFKGDSKDPRWEPYVLGYLKRDLLQDILPIIGTNLRLQRLFTEYQEQLEMTNK